MINYNWNTNNNILIKEFSNVLMYYCSSFVETVMILEKKLNNI